MDPLFLKSFILEAFVTVSILSSLLYNAYVVTYSQNNFPLLDKQVYYQTLFFLIIYFFINANIDFGSTSLFNLFVNDISAINIKTVLILSLFGALVCGFPYFIKQNINLFEYYVLVLLALLSLFFLTCSIDFISIYLCLEMQSLCFYVLASFNRYSVFSTEAGLKYFVLGAFSSCFFLLGSSLLYGLIGTTNLSKIACLISIAIPFEENFLIYFSIALLLISFLFKLTAAPFHIWSPDVYDGAPFNSTIIFILVPKIVFLLLLMRLLSITLVFNFSFFLIIVGFLSVLIGSFFALYQKRIKRLLIYSSISHVGFMLVAIGSNSFLGYVSCFYYMIFYIITGFLAWGLLSLRYLNEADPVYITDYASFCRQNLPVALVFALTFFSLAGIPPLVGFSMKYFVFFSAFKSNLYLASSIIILLSALGSFYYLRVIKLIFFEGSQNYKNLFFSNEPFEFIFILIALSFFLICLGFFQPVTILYFANKIVLGLLLF